jgi:hypothetical protein
MKKHFLFNFNINLIWFNFTYYHLLLLFIHSHRCYHYCHYIYTFESKLFSFCLYDTLTRNQSEHCANFDRRFV